MRENIKRFTGRQYTQDRHLARRILTAPNLERVMIRKNQVRWTIINYAEMSYKQYLANHVRRLTQRQEMDYNRNNRKYDNTLAKMYQCRCTQEAENNSEKNEEMKQRKCEFFEILKNSSRQAKRPN